MSATDQTRNLNLETPTQLHAEFFQYLLAAQIRSLSQKNVQPTLQRSIEFYKHTLGPNMDAETASSIGIIFDFTGTLVTYAKSPLDLYLENVRNKEIRQNSGPLKDLFDKMTKAIKDYLGFKQQISATLRSAELKKADHEDASKAADGEVELTPNAQYTLGFIRDRWNIKRQFVDTSDFKDIAGRVVPTEYGIPGADVKATEAIFDDQNKFSDFKPNIRDHKVENKRQILREKGIDPKLHIYVADVDTEKFDRFRIKKTDPELPLLSAVGYRVAGIFNVVFQRI